MLILGRKAREEVVIMVGDVRIDILVVDIIDGKCRLGFTAPREDAAIHRKEVFDKIDRPQEPEA